MHLSGLTMPRPGSHLTLVSAFPEDPARQSLELMKNSDKGTKRDRSIARTSSQVASVFKLDAQELPPLFRSLIAAFEGIRVPFRPADLTMAHGLADALRFLTLRVDPHGNATNQGIGGMWRSMGSSA